MIRYLRLGVWLVIVSLVAVLAWRHWSVPAPEPLTTPLPVLELVALEGRATFAPATIEGPWLLNVWGSWCAPCHAEHPVLMALRSEGIAIYGVNWRDSPSDANHFLDDLGDPFIAVMQDRDNASVGALGVAGAPETLVIDDGKIIARWPGPLTADALRRTIYPALERDSRD